MFHRLVPSSTRDASFDRLLLPESWLVTVADCALKQNGRAMLIPATHAPLSYAWGRVKYAQSGLELPVERWRVDKFIPKCQCPLLKPPSSCVDA
ncbi:hypothetical protein RJ55_05514 [Drechmeria coniospora]|nr:hypothetical protein RJ55_05514 [Drechmeria coniospora]